MNTSKPACVLPSSKLHIDYFLPLFLDEEFTVRASLYWNEGARINTGFHVIKEDGSLATSAYTVQLFTDHRTGEPGIVSPEMLERCRRRWRAGESSGASHESGRRRSGHDDALRPGGGCLLGGALAGRTAGFP